MLRAWLCSGDKQALDALATRTQLHRNTPVASMRASGPGSTDGVEVQRTALAEKRHRLVRAVYTGRVTGGLWRAAGFGLRSRRTASSLSGSSPLHS